MQDDLGTKLQSISCISCVELTTSTAANQVCQCYNAFTPFQKKGLRGTGAGPPLPKLDPLTEQIIATLDENVEVTSPYDSESSAARNADIVKEAMAGVIEEEDFLDETNDLSLV